MANLLSQNIGTNYKSILNLDATTINTPLDTTLRAVTDGMGTSSPLQLSTDQVGLIRTVALSAGATNPRLFNEVYTINNSGAQTGTLTGLFLNATETALNGITHNLMDLQKGGASFFRVRNDGRLDCGNIVSSGNFFASSFFVGGGLVGLQSSIDGILYLSNSAGTSFGRIQLGGTTSSFPAIKRNGAAIDFRLADDSAYANANVSSFGVYGNLQLQDQITTIGSTDIRIVVPTASKGLLINQDYSFVAAPSCLVEIRSTTKGFLPPRMTTAQVNAIAAPAEGLVVFNTTISHLCVYQAAAWVKINHSPM
jgi:hypothetical protein